jgi:transposase
LQHIDIADILSIIPCQGDTFNMMGYQPPVQENLFYTNITLDERVRKNHPLRKINELIDFQFIYKEVRDQYGSRGNVSVPPPVILKLMFLLVFYNVRSERELMETVPERLDWLWFLGYTFDSAIPDHSVLSKARSRWGQEVFKSFFERIVFQCFEAGLIDGTKIFMDASLIDANASNNSVIDTTRSLERYLHKGYEELENRLEEAVKDNHKVNSRYVSATDPDASIVRHGGTKSKLRYKTHRAVDSLCEVITAVEVTGGSVDDGHKMFSLIETHEANTETKVGTVVADSKYGTKENFLGCKDKGINAHMPVLKDSIANTGSRKGIFSEEQFIYDGQADSFTCPAGKVLKKRTLHKDKQNVEYAASRKNCASCLLKSQCTKSKTGRTVQRHLRQDELDMMFAATQTPQAKRDIKTRQHLMERSFARSTRFDFDRSRWRGLWKLSIQEYLVSAIQNIQTLIRHTPSPKQRAQALLYVKMTISGLIMPFYRVFFLMKEYFTVCSVLIVPKISMAQLEEPLSRQHKLLPRWHEYIALKTFLGNRPLMGDPNIQQMKGT